eukprot:scaffold12209_cov134-Isochrysis_galbana.AAC.3
MAPQRKKSVIGKSSKARAPPSGQQRLLTSLPVQWNREPDLASSSSSSGALRQATLQSLSGVVNWSRGERHAPALKGVPTTLYLGEEDVVDLRERLSAAVSISDEDACLAILRRLAAMPCTRPLLESTSIGVVVGKLRKHHLPAVAELAAKLVKVWKCQLAEHREQRAGRH